MNIIEAIPVIEEVHNISTPWSFAFSIVYGIFFAICFVGIGLTIIVTCDIQNNFTQHGLKILVIALGLPMLFFGTALSEVKSESINYESNRKTEYHIELTDMTPEELAQKYIIVDYETDYWVVCDKTK